MGGARGGGPRPHTFAHTFLTRFVFFKDTMMQVADHLHGAGAAEDVIRMLPNSISDGIFAMMENKETVKSKVRAGSADRMTKSFISTRFRLILLTSQRPPL